MNRKYIVICSFFVAFFVLSLLCYGSFEYAKKQEQKKKGQKRKKMRKARAFLQNVRHIQAAETGGKRRWKQ